MSAASEYIELSYEVSAEVDLQYSLFEDLHIEESGNKTLANGNFRDIYNEANPRIDIDIKLPDGYCDYSSGSDYISLMIEINLSTGVKCAYILGTASRYPQQLD